MDHMSLREKTISNHILLSRGHKTFLEANLDDFENKIGRKGLGKITSGFENCRKSKPTERNKARKSRKNTTTPCKFLAFREKYTKLG